MQAHYDNIYQNIPINTHIQKEKKRPGYKWNQNIKKKSGSSKLSVLSTSVFFSFCFVLFFSYFSRQLSFIFYHTHSTFELVKVIPSLQPQACNNLNTFYIAWTWLHLFSFFL